MSQDDAIIRLEKITRTFDGQLVLDAVDLTVHQGRTTVVIGPSGCGKSVLLKHMIGLLKPDSGRAFFKGREITHLSERELAPLRRQVGFLFQGSALFDSMTVAQNICFPLQQHTVGSAEDRRLRCVEVLSLVGLDGLQDRLPQELSGGQQKRVALARAIVLAPEVILYDEPTTALDPIRADVINELILKLQEVLGTTAVVVTHDMNSARKVADRIVMLYKGRFIADTTPERLDDIDDETVSRFVRGLAGEDDLAQLRTGRFVNNNSAAAVADGENTDE